jgi:uncharacterized protein (TIGR03663 family)
MTGEYDYNPVLHGPFLEDVTALIFLLLGDSDATARLWAALSGVLLILVVWRARDHLGGAAAVFAVLLLAASPTLLYYSRFNRNDVPFTLAAMLFVFCMLRLVERRLARYWFLALLAIAWMICIEETYVIFLFTAATYALGVWIVETVGGGAPDRSGARPDRLAGPKQVANLFHFRPGQLIATALGLASGIFLIILLYTTFFRHPEHAGGPIEAILYWAGQHAEQRIKGEYHYYVPILLLYEFLPLALVVAGVGRTLRRARWIEPWMGWGWAAWSLALFAALWFYEFPAPVASLLHMTRGWHLWLAIEVFALSATACAALVLRGRRIEAFFLWWAMGSFLAYSYAGEKVPWIAVHIAFPMIVAAALFLQEMILECEVEALGLRALPHGRASALIVRRALGAAILVAGFLATAFVGLRLSFVNYDDPAERNVYTHTTRDYLAIVREVRDLVDRTVKVPPAQFPILIEGDSIWPGQWYFRRFLVAHSSPVPGRVPIVFVCDEYIDPDHRTLPALAQWPWLAQTHVVRRVPFREWWHQELLLAECGRLLDIWMALVPKQYRTMPVTDAGGEAVVFFGDRARLPNMTVADEVRASREAWRKILAYAIFRRDFDPYRSPYPTRDHLAVLYGVRKDIYAQWLAGGGRWQTLRSHLVTAPPKPVTKPAKTKPPAL